jgi:hypothetical protein
VVAYAKPRHALRTHARTYTSTHTITNTLTHPDGLSVSLSHSVSLQCEAGHSGGGGVGGGHGGGLSSEAWAVLVLGKLKRHDNDGNVVGIRLLDCHVTQRFTASAAARVPTPPMLA